LEKISAGILARGPGYLQETRENLIQGIEYYQEHSRQLAQEQAEQFFHELKKMHETLESLPLGDG
ncbi:MAG: hypothetical protein HY789_05590, partial [Deltaproteobacteria bacterium]|nr:hypothetical protein [Deltaproteobacteria bacterium]